MDMGNFTLQNPTELISLDAIINLVRSGQTHRTKTIGNFYNASYPSLLLLLLVLVLVLSLFASARFDVTATTSASWDN